MGVYMRPDGTAWSGGLVELLAEFGYSAGAARMALGRLARRRLLERVRVGRTIHYTLTERSRQLLAEGDERIFSLGSDETDGETWTILWHTLPDEQRVARARLTQRLRFLGFGSIHDGSWVHPRDRVGEVTELLEEVGALDHAVVMLAEPASADDVRALAARAWDFDALRDRYLQFVAEFEPLQRRARSLHDREAFRVRALLAHSFRAFPFLDPELSSAVVPDLGRPKAVSLFHELYDVLEAPAQRHFDTVAGSFAPT
jgi:phenylacetic acid degradation operon negative regulatory protein